MTLRQRLIVFAFAIGLLMPSAVHAAPNPVDPLEVATGSDLRDARPWGAPGGEQMITFRQLGPGDSRLLVERRDGAAFATPVELTSAVNTEPTDLSFTPAGGVYAVWGISSSGAAAQQSIREPGGEFGPAAPVTGCGRFVDAAAGPDGRLALACSFTSPTPPLTSNARFTTLPALGPFSLSDLDDRIQPVYDNFINPRVVWGTDGTLAFAVRYKITTTDPPPVNETSRIRVVLPDLAETADLVQVTEPDRAQLGGLAVTDEGRIAVAYSTDTGPLLRIRPAGPTAQPYATLPLPGEEVTEPVGDGDGRIHAMSVIQGPPRAYFANVKAEAAAPLETTTIPLAGAGDPYIPYEDGFLVAPNGTEYAVIRADDGVYATSREPGAPAFATPVRLGAIPDANPEAAVTREGDLMVTWDTGPAGDQTLVLSGLDGNPPKVTIESFPVEGTSGGELPFAAKAVDPMGMRSVRWDFGGGDVVTSETATHAFGPGEHRVSFVATDRAGNETVETRTVRIPGGPQPGGPLTLQVKVPKKLKFRKLARRGVKVKVTANRPVRIRAAIGTSKRKARVKPLKKKATKAAKATQTFRIKPNKKRVGKPRNLKLFVRVTGTTSTGETTTVVKKLRIRR